MSAPGQDQPSGGKVLDADYIKSLLSNKRRTEPKPQKPKPDNTPSGYTMSDSDWIRPKWHGWVYGGQRNPTL